MLVLTNGKYSASTEQIEEMHNDILTCFREECVFAKEEQ